MDNIQVNKGLFELYHFIAKNNCEMHKNKDEIILFLDKFDIRDFMELTSKLLEDYFYEGINATVKNDYMCLDIAELIDYYAPYEQEEYWLNKFIELCE